MIHYQPEKPHIIFLFSDTGGGHRSASEAIIEAINLEFPSLIDCEMVDIFRQYAPRPLNKTPEIYPPLSRMPDVWRAGYEFSNSRRRTYAAFNALWPYVRSSLDRLIRENPCDLFVSVHPLANALVLRALRGRVPLVTVVTDMVSTHVAWYDSRAATIVVPTESARQRGIMLDVPQEKIKVVGMPVADRFCHPAADRMTIRKRLGWPPYQDAEENLPVILLVGGGEGMGPLERTAYAINSAGLKAALVIIAGRNKKLKERLERHDWNMPVHIYGFVKEMPDFMQAADVLVTKAGPGTISEAFIAGLPLILYSKMPGQEDGNVNYVVEEGAGIWAPEPEMVTEVLRLWLEVPETRLKVAQVSHDLARPTSSRQIARLLAEQVGIVIPK